MNAFPCIRPRFLLRLVAIGAVLVCTQLAPAPSTLATAPVAATPRPVPPVRLGQVLTPGEIVELPTLYHRVARITGQLRAGYDALDLLEATFPGGSVTSRQLRGRVPLYPARYSVQ